MKILSSAKFVYDNKSNSDGDSQLQVKTFVN